MHILVLKEQRKYDELRMRPMFPSFSSWLSPLRPEPAVGGVEMRALLQAVLDETPDLVLVKDHEGQFLLCNRHVAELYGTTPEAMVGKHDGDFSATPEQADFFRQNVRAIMAQGQTVEVLEESTDAITGARRFFKSIKRPFHGPDGLPRILVIAHDVTDLRTAQLQAEASEKRLKYVLEATGEGVWDWDVVSGRLTGNRRLHDLLGCTPEALPESVEGLHQRLHPDDAAGVQAALRAALAGQAPYHHEHRMLRCNGEVLWVLDRGDVVERDAAGRALRMVGSFSDITARKQAEQALARQASQDALTGLCNRRALIERLDALLAGHAQRPVQGVLLFVDMDNFKDLNDTWGHHVGDLFLAQVARRLDSLPTRCELVARLGGDEFVLVYPYLGEGANPQELAVRRVIREVEDTLRRPYELGSLSYVGSPSMGVTEMRGAGVSSLQLLRQGDLAMYQAKRAGRNMACFFDPQVEQAAAARVRLLADLRLAVPRRELYPAYQPVVDVHGAVAGAEILARWAHPVRGRVLPAEFIALAEDAGLIESIGQEMLRFACRQVRAWSQEPASAAWFVSVNVSARQVAKADFVARTMEILRTEEVDPQRIKLEITESLFQHDFESASRKMAELHAQGLRFSLDDFGTGYSSLAYLKSLPFVELKIDRSFISGLSHGEADSRLVLSILRMADSLGLNTVAEGVETLAQRDFLVANGCTFFQGYLFGQPGPADQVGLAVRLAQAAST